MKKLIIPTFALFLWAAHPAFPSAQSGGTSSKQGQDGGSIKQDGKQTGNAAGNLGKNTAK